MNRLALTLGLAVMQTCWVAPWAIVLGWRADQSQQRALLSAPSVFGLVLLAALATHGLGRRAAARRAGRFGLAVLGLIVALGAVQLSQPSAPELAIALGLWLWWRGARIGSQTATYSDIESAFRWGIGALVGFGLIVGLTTRPSQLAALEGPTTVFVVLFFFVSLVTLALGRLESLRARTSALAVNSQWLGVLLGVAGLVVLVALLLGQLFAFDLLVLASRPLFDLLGNVILVLIYIIVIPLAYLVELLIFVLLSWLRAGDNLQLPSPPQGADVDSVLRRLLAQGLPADVLLALKAVAAALLLWVALAMIARAVARWRPSSAEADETDEERDSLWQPGPLRARLLAWLRGLLRPRRGPAAALSAAVAGELASLGIVPPDSARGLYRRLLQLGAAAGAPRTMSTTPLEHLGPLARALQPESPLDQLTTAYMEVRYADQPLPAGRLEVLQQQLELVHARSPESDRL